MVQVLVLLSQLKGSNRLGCGNKQDSGETGLGSLPTVTQAAGYETRSSSEETQGQPCSKSCWKSPTFMGQEHGLWFPLKLSYLTCKMGHPTSTQRALGLPKAGRCYIKLCLGSFLPHEILQEPPFPLRLPITHFQRAAPSSTNM